MDISRPVQAMYDAYPSARERFNYLPDFETYIKEVAKKPLRDLSLHSLDRYDSDFHLCALLVSLPLKAVQDVFGKDVIYWLGVRAVTSNEVDRVQSFISAENGKDKATIERARLAAWQLMHYSSKSADVAANDYLFQSMNDSLMKKVNLERLLRETSKEGVRLTKERLHDYELKTIAIDEMWASGYSKEYFLKKLQKNKMANIYLDTPKGLCLTYRGLPNCVAGIIADGKKRVHIIQLQGVLLDQADDNGRVSQKGKYSSRGLFPLDWQRTMVRAVEAAGSELGFQRIIIQSGYNNRWIHPNHGKIHLPLESALKAYDQVAERLGFTQLKNKDWSKAISHKRAKRVLTRP